MLWECYVWYDWWGAGWMSGWGQTIWILPHSSETPTALRKRSRAVGLKRWEVSHSDRSAAIIMQQPWVFNGVISATSSCQQEISRLVEPVNLPASLGTCHHHVNWCMHLQQYCLIFTHQNYCSCDKWIGKIWFQGSLNYCTLGATHMMRYWVKEYQYRRSIKLPSHLCTYCILLCCYNSR